MRRKNGSTQGGGGWVGGGTQEFCFGIDPPRPDEDITRSSQYSAQCLLLPSPASAAPLAVTATTAAAAPPPTAASSTSSPNAAAPTRAPLTAVEALQVEELKKWSLSNMR